MAKSVSQVNSGRPRMVVGVRGRDVEFPRAPVHVTDAAQAKLVDINTARKFDFGERERGPLPERPSTSAGPVHSKRKNAEKRETKDDLHFNPLAAHGTGTTFYNFPLPGSLPTPDHTPREALLPPGKTSLDPHHPRTLTPDSMQAAPATMAVPQMEIGMALGSPSHPPTDWNSQTHSDAGTRTASPDTMDDSMGGTFSSDKAKGKQLQPEASKPAQAAEPDLLNLGEPSPSSEKRPKSRGRGRSISTRKQKPTKSEMKRANTVPLRFDFQENGRTPTPEITLDGGPLKDTNHSGHTGNYSGQMLDVDIPSIQMERYSIMFGSVLQKPTTTASTLLARRQATLDKLKTVNEALASKEHEIREKEKRVMARRATSPQPTKSPAFSLFPSTPSRQGMREGSPSRLRAGSGSLQRSNTSPAALSPSRPSFAPGLDNEAHAILVSQPNEFAKTKVPICPIIKGHEKQDSKSPSKDSPASVPKAPERSWPPEESHLVLDSPNSNEEEEDYTFTPSPMLAYSTAPLRPKLVEPAWEIINRPHSNDTQPPKTSSSTSGSDHSASSSTSASSLSTAATSQSVATTAYTASAKHKPIIIPTQASQAAALSQPLPTPQPSTSKNPTSSIPRSRRNPSEISNSSIASSAFSVQATAAKIDDDEKEARLKTAADVSIARQISVSRQQRQLLVPIRAKSASNNSLNKKYTNQSLSPIPSPSVGRATSPLGAVAIANSEETDRMAMARSAAGVESPLLGSAMGMPMSVGAVVQERKERLVAGVKPSTPTLVFVPGPKDNENVQAWGVQNPNAATHNASASAGSVGLAERRKGRGNVMGEIKVGLTVNRVDGHGHGHGHQHRKSERALVERVSVVSN
ncbi:hypothetical protein G7Y89_g12312 [Cudoniella acicularis]|uniref:Uncharacterized protein n=1 Tax=Cudoniella acicularis TaxID=354080 RepID=A0A8H4R9A9_9HELO|nr:hypothetical protein G7Y89_g12312 [Cudoniella acicularis]